MSYTITTDASLLPPNATRMISFMESFYQTSDTETWHDKYVASFTPDATLIMGPKVAKGGEEIRNLRLGLWTHVAARKHSPARAYFGGEHELMLYGSVRYMLRSEGREVEVPWAARVVFDGGEELRMKFYQVYLDTAVQSGR